MSAVATIRVLVTGAGGLLGYHARAAMLARNCEREFRGELIEFEVIEASRRDFVDARRLASLVRGCAAVLHLAGVNRASPAEVEGDNESIAATLIEAIRECSATPHVVYANSTHAGTDSPYGRGKEAADRIFADWSKAHGAHYSNVVLPHIFGEGGVPFYNTVTATLCRQVVDGDVPIIHEGAAVELLHAGEAVDRMLLMIERGEEGTIRLSGRSTNVADLHGKLSEWKVAYDANQFPELDDPFDVALFNTYRAVEFPNSFPRALKLNDDARGTLFEAVKGGGGGQTFLSWTEPGVERGNHFHRHKVERFLVLFGTAEIRLRRLYDDTVHRFSVSGDVPEVVDMPTLHTHSIVNTGRERLLTLFWAHEVFDPERPDTYAHSVIDKQELGNV